MDGSDATAAPFPFSDLRMMFIELRGASPIDHPAPHPRHPPVLPSSPHSQCTTPPILPRKPPLPAPHRRFTSGGGGATVKISHAPHWGPVVKQIVCRCLQLRIFGFDYPPRPQSTHCHPPPPPPRVLVIVVIRRPLKETDFFSLRSFFDPSGGRNGVDLQLL